MQPYKQKVTFELVGECFQSHIPSHAIQSPRTTIPENPFSSSSLAYHATTHQKNTGQLIAEAQCTPPNFRDCARRKVLVKRFKICHILYIRKPKVALSISCYFMFFPNECPGLCPGHALGEK